MKTSELTGDQLDYWVARAEGHEKVVMRDGRPCMELSEITPGMKPGFHLYIRVRNYSSDWYFGGPIIERERIKLMPTIPTAETWHATKCSSVNLADMIVWRGKADTPLVAAMRCYVRSKFGDEVPND